MKAGRRFHLQRTVHSERGFTLVATMMALASLGVLTMAVMTLLKSMNSQAQHVNSTAGARALISSLQGTIGYQALCFTSLDSSTQTYDGALAASPSGLPLSFNLGAGLKVAAGETLRPYDVKVKSLSFVSTTPPIGADPLIAGNQLYSGQLFLDLTKLGGDNAAGGATMLTRAVGTLILSVNTASNAISRCYALVDADQACAELNGIFDPAGSPKCKLPFPCAGIPNSIFMGYDTANNPQCKTVAQIVGNTCPAGQYLTADGAGGATCQTPP
jgi:competence protein ComGC